MGQREMAAGEFKAKCLQAMDDVEASGEEIVITKRGRPVAKLVPIAAGPVRSRGVLRGTVTITGDLVASTGETWNADR